MGDDIRQDPVPEFDHEANFAALLDAYADRRKKLIAALGQEAADIIAPEISNA